MSETSKIFVGSRKSELALIQTRYVISLLKDIHPEKEFEIVTMSTLGDKILDTPLPKIGEKSLFTKELETALSLATVDFVVHSLKDLPTTLPAGMAIGAVLAREDPRDALVLQKDQGNFLLDTLPKGSVIGTSSLRRSAQLARKYPHLKVESIRGNLNTRLRKLDELGKFQAIILAASGLIRMGWNSRITKILDCDELLYAVGQGALAVECRENDDKTIELLRPLYDIQTCLRVIAERSFLKTLGGGCSAPVAVSTDLLNVQENDYKMIIKGAVWSLDGVTEISDTDECNLVIKEKIKCPNCPFKRIAIIDIENCNKCPESPKMPPMKRARKTDTSIELLTNDPHEDLPIGVDFMGKCPYLESTGLVKIYEKQQFKMKCPFFYNVNIEAEGTSQVKTFCGLIPHNSVSLETMETCLDLGRTLAGNLMKKGATEVMSKAQATIHGAISTSAS